MLPRSRPLRVVAALGGLALVATALAACSSASPSSGGKVSISFQTGNSPANLGAAKDLVAAFEKANPNISVKVDAVPQGTEGDNLIKTQLSTGSADDVLFYNSGSLLQALHPDSTMVDLSKEPWVENLTSDFKQVVSTSKGVYGAPFGSSFAGGVLYNKKVYDKLGLKVPTTWDEFISNSKKVQAAGIIPIVQTFGDTWTSQLFVLGDFANVTAQSKNWAADYTANKAKYANEPALEGFQHQEDAFKAGLFNKDYASANNVAGLAMLATGQAAQYPMLTVLIATIQQNNPEAVNDIGFFALPADSAKDTRATIWQPNALYITKTATGAKLDAAKKLVAFANSSAGCKIQDKAYPPAGPYVDSSCKLPSDAPDVAADVQKYFDTKKTGSALEFLSPIKGPNLENITVQVGSGISTAKQGAALYDDDVKKQAQQLGLKGW